VTPSRNVILKSERLPKIGEQVVNEKLKQIGAVFDMFGPISSPYIAVKIGLDNPNSLVNQILYVIPSSRSAKRGKEKRK